METSVQLTLLGRAALATLFGFAIGLEREARGKAAGERTFALLALGTALFSGAGAELFGAEGTSRVVQGVTAGVGFIGAGIIFRREGDVRGLTTAASSWATAAIGTVVGLGGYLAGLLVTLLVLLILELDQIPVLRRIRERAEGDEDQTGG